MNKTVRILAVAAAVSSLGAAVRADEFDDFDDLGATPPAAAPAAAGESAPAADGDAAPAAEGEAAPAADGEDAAAKAGEDVSQASGKLFDTLPVCSEVYGVAEVFRPGSQSWEPAQEGKAYALGTAYRTVGAQSKVVIKLGKAVSVVATGDSSFRTCAQALDVQSRTVALDGGVVKVNLPNNMPDGKFIVSAPGFSVVNPKGASSYTYTRTGDGDEALVRCVTGDLSVEGRHFKIVRMKVATEVRIRTSQDLLFTGLYGSRGDLQVMLDQGRVVVKDYDTGATHEEDKTLEFKLSPLTAVRIHRAMPAIGSKLAVSVMTFDAAGSLRNRCTFTENTACVNTGELGPGSKKERDEADKKAAEAAESVDVDVEPEPEAGAGQDGGAQEGGDAPAPAADAAPAGGDDDLLL